MLEYNNVKKKGFRNQNENRVHQKSQFPEGLLLYPIFYTFAIKRDIRHLIQTLVKQYSVHGTESNIILMISNMLGNRSSFFFTRNLLGGN